MGQFKARLVVVLLHLFAKIPLAISRLIGASLGYLAFYCRVREARTAEVNIRLCYPDLTPLEVREAVRHSLVNTGKTVAEMGMAWLWPADKTLSRIKKVNGEALFQSAIAAEEGVVIISPHIGNWEVMGIYLAAHTDMAALYQPPKLLPLEPIIKAARSRNGSELVPTNKRGVSRLLKRLKEGGVLGILPDQEPDPEGGVYVDFFHYPALTMTLVSKLASKTGAKVLCAFATRSGNGFEVNFLAPDEMIYSSDLEESVRGLNLSVENCINTQPWQYQWGYKRYKRHQEGRKDIYRT